MGELWVLLAMGDAHTNVYPNRVWKSQSKHFSVTVETVPSKARDLHILLVLTT